MRYRVWASNVGVGSFDLGIYPSDDADGAIKDASKEFINALYLEGKVLWTTYRWVYNAVPVADGLK